MTTTEPRHRYSVERLYHFACHACGAWWSIADWPASPSGGSGALYCPHCGRHARAEPMPAEPAQSPPAECDAPRPWTEIVDLGEYTRRAELERLDPTEIRIVIYQERPLSGGADGCWDAPSIWWYSGAPVDAAGAIEFSRMLRRAAEIAADWQRAAEVAGA